MVVIYICGYRMDSQEVNTAAEIQEAGDRVAEALAALVVAQHDESGTATAAEQSLLQASEEEGKIKAWAAEEAQTPVVRLSAHQDPSVITLLVHNNSEGSSCVQVC